MKKVAMFVTNPCTHDARVIKEAMSLSKAGYELRVFALANHFSPEGLFEENGYTVQRIKFDNIFLRCINFCTKSTIRFLKLLLLPFALFWNFIISPVFGVKKIEKNKAASKQETTGRYSPFLRKLKVSQYSIYQFNKTNLGFTFAVSFNQIVKLAYKIAKVPYRLFAITKSKLIRLFKRTVVKVLMPFHKVSTYYYFCIESAKLANEWGAEIVHCHDLNTMYVGKLLKDEDSSRKVVYDSHELWIHRNRVGRKAILERWFDKFCEKRLIPYADEIITVCDSIADWLKARYPSTPKITILRNMPYKLTKKSENSTGLKERLNIPQDQVLA